MATNWQLPPLILHPFSGGGSTEELLEGSRASLALQGFVKSGEEDAELERMMLAGRYQEIRMLLFLGKDLFRWLHQCVEFLDRSGEKDPRVNEQSFAALIVEEPPEAVRTKLEKWGVTDRRAVFSRAIGVNSLFNNPPSLDALSPLLLRHYHRFADYAYICYQHLRPFLPLDPKQYQFDLYASEEYARFLADQWENT